MFETNKIYQGNCIDVIKTFPNKSIDCVITSPPYWQLRDYGWDGQWGMENTFKKYLENLWNLMDEIFRVLKDTGTVFINLGDTYGGTGIKTENHNLKKCKNNTPSTGYGLGNKEISKCLLLIPHRFAIGCIDIGWIVRNDIVWAKRNGMPESVTDRFSKKHEYFFFMVKSEKYYFDLNGIRDKNITSSNIRNKIIESYGIELKLGKGIREWNNNNGKNPGSVSDFWDIPTQPNSDKHFASFNTKLIEKPIIAGCPKDGVILDPFCGTATTGCRAIDLGRKFIGIEGNKEYVKIANKKLSPYLITQQLF